MNAANNIQKIFNKLLDDNNENERIHYVCTTSLSVQIGSQKLLLITKESIVSSKIFSGPPCIIRRFGI